MSFSLRITLLLFLSAFVFMTGQAQIRKVMTCNPMSKNASPYSDIYESDYVDEQPRFPGGERGLINFINNTRKYPYNAYKSKVEGRVLCSFIVNPDGSVSNAFVIKGVEESLNKEALRIINSMPNWTAGKVDNEPVKVRCILPIAFRL